MPDSISVKENSVFISYRRKNAGWAMSVFLTLTSRGYKVFLDTQNINSGRFDERLYDEIAKRKYFILILTPDTLVNCVDANDWVRQEIEYAIEQRLNILPLTFDDFDWKDQRQFLKGRLNVLDKYNTIEIPLQFFNAAMD